MIETEATGSWQKRFDYKYLSVNHLPDKGDVDVTIKKITDAKGAKVAGKTLDTTLIYFNEFQVPLVLNKTNAKNLQWNFGTKEMENWVGKKCKLYIEYDVDAFGTKTDGTRIRKNSSRGVFIPENRPKQKLDFTDGNYAQIKEWLKGDGKTLAMVTEKYELTEKALADLKTVKVE